MATALPRWETGGWDSRQRELRSREIGLEEERQEEGRRPHSFVYLVGGMHRGPRGELGWRYEWGLHKDEHGTPWGAKVVAPGNTEQEELKTVLREPVVHGPFCNAGWVSLPLGRLHRRPVSDFRKHLKTLPPGGPAGVAVASERQTWCEAHPAELWRGPSFLITIRADCSVGEE